MKKRTLFLVLLIVMIAIPCAIASAASYRYVSGTSFLKLRQLPSTEGKVLTSYRADFAVVSYKTYDKDWAYVFFSDGHEGYVMSKYLKTSKSFTAYVTTDNTHLRKGPYATYGSKGRMPRGTRVTVLTSGNTWDYVSSVYGTGYVNKSYLTKTYIAPKGKIKVPYIAYVVNPRGNSVNVREKAGTQYEVIATLQPGTKVKVLSVGNSWARISCTSPAVEGYMMQQYLDPAKTPVTIGPSEAPTFAPTPTPPPFKRYTAYIISSNGKSVNFRSGPGTGHATIKKLAFGTKVTVVEHTNENWSRITPDDKTYGYVKNEFLTRNKPKATVRTYTGWIKATEGEKVNVHNGPGTGYATVYQLLAFTKITIIDDNDLKNWTHIKYSFIEGYVKSEFITRVKPEFTPKVTEDPRIPHSKFPFTAYITSKNGNDVNVRTGAGTGYSLAGSLPIGTKVTVTGVNGNWYHIKTSKLHGYVKDTYLTTKKVTPVPSPTKTGPGPEQLDPNATVVSKNGHDVNMRRGPGTGYSNVTTVPNNARITVIGTSGDWYHVYYNKKYGYIRSEFVARD